MDQKQAKKHIKQLKGFYWHLASYITVCLFLFFLNILTSHEFLWSLIPIFGWGIGLALHAFGVFFGGKKWEERKMQQLTGLSDTIDEVEKLSERTDTLIKILSSVNWEKIDPKLLSVQQNLKRTQSNIEELKRGSVSADSDSKEQVKREIEKLEEFVTSSKFDYYELAAKDSEQNRSS